MSAIRPATDKELKALGLADRAHAGVMRKYTGEPYIRHPVRVADMVRLAGEDEDAVSAAYLHDTVEDTWVTLKHIEKTFGDRVEWYVWFLTELKQPGENRVKRKQRTIDRLRGSPAPVATIKLADLIDNTVDIVRHDPDFAKTYMREKWDLLQVLRHGNGALFDAAERHIMEYFRDEDTNPAG